MLKFKEEAMHNTEESHEFTIPATPLPQACSTVIRNKYKSSDVPDRVKNICDTIDESLSFRQGYTAVLELQKKLCDFDNSGADISNRITDTVPSNTPISNNGNCKKIKGPNDLLSALVTKDKKGVEESTFSNALNLSDLDRDEMYCKENWTYLPLEKRNLSVTGINNSEINPPDFMPIEDSLFKELSPSTLESLMVNSVSYQRMKSKYEIDDISVSDERPVKLEPYGTCDDPQKSISIIPSIKDISLALRSCDISSNPHSLMDEVLKAGKDQSRKSSTSCLSQSDSGNQIQTLENSLIWGSVNIGSSQIRSVHIINPTTSDCEIKFEINIEGNDSFQIVQSSNQERHQHLLTASSLSPGSYELNVAFMPKCVGLVSGVLKIASKNFSSAEKKISLCGYGGKSNLILSNLDWDLSAKEKLLIINTSDLDAKCVLKNTGTASSYFNFSFGLMDEYFVIDQSSGVVKPGELTVISIKVKKDKQVLMNLLNAFVGPFSQIATLIIYHGEEATRLRLKQVYNKCKESDSKYSAIISNQFSYILHEYCGQHHPGSINCFDNSDSINHLLANDIHQTQIAVKIEKDYVYNCLKTLM